MRLLDIYEGGIPPVLCAAMDAPVMARLKLVGMNCGCEYTSFPRFRGLPPYSRFDHSVGAALITWHFTHSRRQALAALFHDIATPCFAHVVDFMLGDALTQEATEGGTARRIAGSREIGELLRREGLALEDVSDYHIYPIADNESPKLSADRLEYTLSNLVCYGFADRRQVSAMYADLTVGRDEQGAPELCFRTVDAARAFARGALEMSRIYAGDQDRFAMRALADLLLDAVRAGAIGMDDLWTTEPELIEKLERDPRFAEAWKGFRAYRAVQRRAGGRIIRAKKRFIDPLVMGMGRVRALDSAFADELDAFLSDSQEVGLVGR
ncbi:MAG: hypothetical protein E7317_02065 [Clostridiales bacterium]|nr:hypothetical protein [Clostridiales bacterium]